MNPSKLIRPFLTTLLWTGMRSDEARTLQWSQVDFEAGEVIVGKAKTEAGSRRVIPTSAALKVALEQHAAFCARKLGPLQPDWYIFPLSNRTRPIDATEPVTSLKTAWETVARKSRREWQAAGFASSCRFFGHADFLHGDPHWRPARLPRRGIIRGSSIRQPLVSRRIVVS